jgi:hypothetical protein
MGGRETGDRRNGYGEWRGYGMGWWEEGRKGSRKNEQESGCAITLY